MFGFFKTKVTRPANPSAAVKPNTSALLDERGWTKTSRGWAGPIKTAYGQWPGIVELAGDQVKAYIRYLPEELRQHAQGISFQQQASGWFRVELALSPVGADPDAVIRYIERMIVRAAEHNLPNTRQDLAA